MHADADARRGHGVEERVALDTAALAINLDRVEVVRMAGSASASAGNPIGNSAKAAC
jgi:hypothetical protein